MNLWTITRAAGPRGDQKKGCEVRLNTTALIKKLSTASTENKLLCRIIQEGQQVLFYTWEKDLNIIIMKQDPNVLIFNSLCTQIQMTFHLLCSIVLQTQPLGCGNFDDALGNCFCLTDANLCARRSLKFNPKAQGLAWWNAHYSFSLAVSLGATVAFLGVTQSHQSERTALG